ncbi:hypothetical protein [Clostridium sp. JS66]|uniref:hypothetical protein n=1 Tax=Clostridium sp. JS66 TaxID=3064705 RepID=UPI00298D8135|nr:hypothetical protein [Clostridium sp. JS66]WPC42380.1 hypothetical protein Q6H37_02645 [Clostridium sp. JS66]
MKINSFDKSCHHELFKRFNKYKKWKDLFDFSSLECKIAVIFTGIILWITYSFNIYADFKSFEVAIQNVALYIASALIGMIGIILAGIAVIISMLNKNVTKEIERLNGKDSVDEILVSFEFLTFIIGIQIITFFLTYIILYSPLSLPTEKLFYLIFAVLSYIFVFTIFYTVSLVSNNVKLFLITNTYNEVIESEKSIYSEANEIRIDFILNMLIESYGIKKESFLSELQEFVDKSDIKEKEVIKNYLRQYYSGDT